MKKIRLGLYWSVDWHHMEVTKMLDNDECEITETWISEDTGEECKEVEIHKIAVDGDEEYVYAKGYEEYAKPGCDEYSWWARKYATGATNWEPEEEDSTMTKDIDKIKDYWMATMNMGETREEMEEIWSTKDGLDNLMEWFDGEIEEGITEEEMDQAINAVEKAQTKKEDKEMADKNMVKIEQITVDGIVYTSTRPGYYYKRVDGKQTRIPKAEWEQVFEKWQTEVDAERKAREEAQDKSDREAEDAVNGKKKEKKARRPKDIAHESNGKTLTAKQVDFIRHIPDTCFYENGLESTMWCDCLADEIGGQFAGKPMTVGAMISTLREKDIVYVGVDRVNGKKAKFFGFTETGKEIAKELGLN